MKFCKNLQRVVDISDPEWAPYWTNYKMLKKLIKELPSLVPADGETRPPRPSSPSSSVDSTSMASEAPAGLHQQRGDKTAETTYAKRAAVAGTAASSATAGDASSDQPYNLMRRRQTLTEQHRLQREESQVPARSSMPAQMPSAAVAGDGATSSNTGAGSQQPHVSPANDINKSPGEIAFFKLLHTEFKKASHFFGRAQQEFVIREERVREGMEIMKKPNSIMVNEKWSLLAKSIYRLYKDLLLLETFAIMTYCSFSKILKKHDKVTGYDTRLAFMANVVNKANFTNYPRVLEMISRCETLYAEVSEHLQREGKQGLYEDERLFINMIHRLNEQVLDTAENDEGAERKVAPRRPVVVPLSKPPTSEAARNLRLLVEENDQKRRAAQVSGHEEAEGCCYFDSDNENEKPQNLQRRQRKATRPEDGSPPKRQRVDGKSAGANAINTHPA